jgi:RNA polymerase sigma factor (sigma-70 family)
MLLILNELYIKAKDGSEKDEHLLFEKLTERFTYFTLQLIRDKDDAREIVQDVLMAISGKYREIDFRVSFTSWAYAVLNNRIKDYFKIRKRRREITEQHLKGREEAVSRPVDPVLRIKLVECLKKIHAHNERHALILSLHYEGYTTDEICRVLALSRNNFYVQLSRARGALEKCLKSGDIK